MLAEAATPSLDLPPFDSSAMDGYAVRAGTRPGGCRVVGQSAAGQPSAGRSRPGEAVAISTGAVVPAGADAVVPVEETRARGRRGRRSPRRRRARTSARAAATPQRVEVVVPAGTRLRPAQIGALAAAGVAASASRAARASRCSRPAASCVAPGAPLAPGQIYEANTLLLAAQLAAAGADVERARARRRRRSRRRRAALARGLEADVLVTSGGVSVGPHDLVRAALGQLGVEEVFWRVAVRPGKPVAFGVRGRTLVFGLPGNPVSSLVGCELFVRPALLALQGAREPGPSLPAGRLGARACGATRSARSSSGRGSAAETDGVVLEPVARPGVAHDRRVRPPPMRSC